MNDSSAVEFFQQLMSQPDGKRAFFDEVVSAHSTLFGSRGGPYNIDAVSYLAAALESYEYAQVNMAKKPRFTDRSELLTYSVGQISIPGPVLEFGVFSGHTINHIAGLLPDSRLQTHS